MKNNLIKLVFVGLMIVFLSLEILSHKSSFKIDTKSTKCYDNCINNEAKYNSYFSAREIDMFNYGSLIDNMQVLHQKIVEQEAERLIALEKKRIAHQKKKQEEEEKMKQVVVSRGEQAKPKWIIFEASYYTAFCDTGCSGITALGWDVSNTIYHNDLRVIAVDPKVIPLGSIVEISTPYDNFKAVAGDTGGAIKGYKVDILVESKQKAIQLGRHKIQLRILKKKGS